MFSFIGPWAAWVQPERYEIGPKRMIGWKMKIASDEQIIGVAFCELNFLRAMMNSMGSIGWNFNQ